MDDICKAMAQIGINDHTNWPEFFRLIQERLNGHPETLFSALVARCRQTNCRYIAWPAGGTVSTVLYRINIILPEGSVLGGFVIVAAAVPDFVLPGSAP